jgi:hypothetical protein
MKKQTAIQWLLEEWPILESQILPRIIEQAKAMEMQYIMDAFIKGELNYLSKEIQTPKEYYNETYNK